MVVRLTVGQLTGEHVGRHIAVFDERSNLSFEGVLERVSVYPCSAALYTRNVVLNCAMPGDLVEVRESEVPAVESGVLEGVWRLYRDTCAKTAGGCSDDLELFLSNLRELLEGRRPECGHGLHQEPCDDDSSGEVLPGEPAPFFQEFDRDQVADRVRAVLRCELGHETPYEPHSWRCHDKDRYPGPCGCADEIADGILEQLDEIWAGEDS